MGTEDRTNREETGGKTDCMEQTLETKTSLLPNEKVGDDDGDDDDDDDAEVPVTKDTACGFWFIRCSCLQVLASKKSYVLLFGITFCIYSTLGAYFYGTITSLEKRFKYPSWKSGVISSGIDVCSLCFVLVSSYYGGKGHKPRWIAFGNIWTIVSCLIMYLPHALYGSGKDSLDLTLEHGGGMNHSGNVEIGDKLCKPGSVRGCDEESGSFWPPLILFLGHFVLGIGNCLLYCLGLAYMDDNIEKSKTPFLISIIYFMKMLGPALGFSLASFCLRFYISPELTPIITQDDPRWIGAWWLGWIILAVALTIVGLFFAMFPRELPRAAMRRAIAKKKNKGKLMEENSKNAASLKDMKETVIRLLKNKVYMCNNFASVFYFLGNMPYFSFMIKYIETLYQKNASMSNFYTGTVSFVFASIGIVVSGAIISKFQPSARALAAWSLVTGVANVLGMFSYSFLGCDVPQLGKLNLNTGELNMTMTCNAHCDCDQVSFSPVCSSGQISFATPCHAGCMNSFVEEGQEVFSSCACIPSHEDSSNFGTAVSGYCPWDCDAMFYTFLAIVCILTFMGASARAAEFLVGIRCIEERDKSTSMGLTQMMFCVLTWMPGPTFFGWIFDSTCLIWGKTCTGTGNCWLYDSEALRYRLNLTTASLVTVSVLFDSAVWYYVKDITIFDS